MRTFTATLTYRDPPRSEIITVPLPPAAPGPPKVLRRPTMAPGLLEVFELIDDDDWAEHQLAGYVFVGTVEQAP